MFQQATNVTVINTTDRNIFTNTYFLMYSLKSVKICLNILFIINKGVLLMTMGNNGVLCIYVKTRV